MTNPGVPGRKSDLRSGPLYRFLFDTFPDHRTAHGILDIHRLKRDLSRSYQAVYNWLGTNSLTPENARRIVAAASTAENAEALARLGRKPPTIENLTEFVFA